MTRLLAVPLLGLALLALVPAPATAQPEAFDPNAGQPPPEDPGDPIYAYAGTAFLAAGCLFVLCKSARR